MSQTRVVNKDREECDVYIGRGSYFGNPQHIGIHGTREEVLDFYAKYFRYRLRSEPGFHEKVMALQGKRLGCHCKPKACHGDIIKEYIDSHETR